MLRTLRCYALYNAIRNEMLHNEDVNEAWSLPKTGLLHNIDSCMPKKVKRTRSVHEPFWFNKVVH